MAHEPEHFLDKWHQKADWLLDGALEFLAEAGIQLATGASRTLPDIAKDIEVPVAEKFVMGFVDPWVVHALVDFLHAYVGPGEPQLKAVYRELVTWLVSPSKPGGPRTVRMIMRNMYINPRAEMIGLFEQNALQALEPSERDLIYLPALERHHQTEGWRPTQAAICKKMNLDHAELLAALRGE